MVRALDAATGEEKWETRFSDAIESSPAFSQSGSAIYLGGGDQQMHALRTTDGGQI